jgi:hypothetical protein
MCVVALLDPIRFSSANLYTFFFACPYIQDRSVEFKEARIKVFYQQIISMHMHQTSTTGISTLKRTNMKMMCCSVGMMNNLKST